MGTNMPGPTEHLETKTQGRKEDRVTGAIESQTSRIPSSGFLGVALASMAASAGLKLFHRDGMALFIGQWVPTLLILGVYNKMVKQLGSDYESHELRSKAATPAF